MLRRALAMCAALSWCGCAAGVSEVHPAGPMPMRPQVARPTWLELVGDEIEAVRACAQARAPEPTMVVHVQPLNDLRVGVVTLGLDGTVERCVHRVDLVEYRARARELRATDFAGQPAVWPISGRPTWLGGAYVEEVVAGGVTVAWVQWLGTGGAQ